jgi:hypothetical protein
MDGYHDAVRRLVVVRQGPTTHHLDLQRLEWQKVDAHEPAALIPGHAARTAFVLDRHSSLGVLVDVPGRALWAYDADERRWRRLEPSGPPFPTGSRPCCYSDPARRVLVVIDNTVVWACRMPDR